METKLQIEPMPIGARVSPLVLGDEQDPDVRKRLYDAWLQHGVLVFKGVQTTEHHLALSRVFGELELHPLEFVRNKEEPLLMNLGIGPRSRAMVYDGVDVRVGRIPWHRDTAYEADICKGGMLRMLEVPDRDGQTLIADTAMAYDGLPDELKEQIEKLEYVTTHIPMELVGPGALWKTVRPATRDEDADGVESNPYNTERMKNAPKIIHPLVLTHPESDRKCIFLSPKDTVRVLGLDENESAELIHCLVEHMTHADYVYKHEWAVNDAVIWDNRRMLHAAVGNHPNHTRRAVRTTLAETMRTGRYLNETETA